MEIKLSGEIVVCIIAKIEEETLINDLDVSPCFWYFSIGSYLISSKNLIKMIKVQKILL